MRNNLKKVDKLLFIFMIIFTILGLVMIYSASSITAVLYNMTDSSYFFKKHLYIILASWIFGFIVLNRKLSDYKVLAPLGMLIISGLLLGLILYGTLTNGVKSWYDLGFFSFQPSEFAKSIIIVYLGVSLEKIFNKNKYDITNLMTPFLLVVIAAFLTAIQPDLGTAAIIGAIAFFIFLSLPSKDKKITNLKRLGVVTLLLGSIVLLFGGNFLTEEQSSRLTYQKPCTRYLEKTGYQVCNGFLAISNGGLFGTGLGNSTQKYAYLPEAYTDFVFPIVTEELGSIGAIVIIIGFIIMLYRILKIARDASSLKGSIMAYGTFLFITFHLLINFMGVLAIIPLTGVPVPFISYGGSFYINIIFCLFLTQRVHLETYETKKNKILKGEV